MKKEDVLFMKVKTFEEFKEFIDKLDIKGKTFIIKPNWVEPSKGQYTEPTPLRWLFECLDGKKVIIESHTAWRNKILLETGEVVVNEKNMNEKKDFLREQEKWFLEYTGLSELLREYNVEYINVTEEVWKGEIVDSKTIQQIVEKKFSPIKHKELYGVIPRKIFELRDEDTIFIDFAKIKTDGSIALTLSTKNLFGLIPDPKRSPKYHDHEIKILPHAILDMNKIYRALFNCVFINEGIFTAIDGPSPEAGRLKENLNLIVGGKNSIDVDLVTAKLVGINPEILLTKLLNPTKEVFGSNPEILKNIPENFVNKFNYEK
jgi:uncharacterized protein (DUF362 family)